MKLQAAKAVHYDSGPNMTPLVDVVMVILIFLMLAGTFGAMRHFMPTTIRDSGLDRTGGPPRIATMFDVFVRSRPDGGFSAKFGGGETFSDPDALAAALNKRRETHEAAGTAPHRLEILIHPRLTTRHEDLIAVYQAAMDAKWPAISFASARD